MKKYKIIPKTKWNGSPKFGFEFREITVIEIDEEENQKEINPKKFPLPEQIENHKKVY